MKKRLFALLMALVLVFSVSALAETAETTETAPADTLLATINGEEIRENNEILQSYYSSYLDSVDEGNAHRMEIVRMYSMDMALHVAIIMQRAKEIVTEEDLAAFTETARSEWAEIIDSYVTYYGNVTAESTEDEKAAARADVLADLEAQGWTEDLYIASYLESQTYTTFIEKELAKLGELPENAVSDADVQAAFDERVKEDQEVIGDSPMMYEYYPQFTGEDSYYIPEGYRGITHILLAVDQDLLEAWTDLKARLEEANTATESEDIATETTAEGETAETTEASAEPTATPEPVTQEMVDAAEQAILDSVADKLKEIRDKLAAGAVFEDLIAEYGTDSGMKQEQYLKNGYAVHKDSIMYDSRFTEAAAKLEKVGDVSDPVVTSFGVHLLHYLRDIPGGAIELTDALKDEIRSSLATENQEAAFNDLVEQWYNEANIVWADAGEEWKFDEAKIQAWAQESYAEAEETPAADAEATPAPEAEAEASSTPEVVE